MLRKMLSQSSLSGNIFFTSNVQPSIYPNYNMIIQLYLSNSLFSFSTIYQIDVFLTRTSMI